MANKYDVACRELKRDGWCFSHHALYNGYNFSGTVSPMQTRGGVQYCRVHTGRSRTVRKNGFAILCQETLVYSREVPAWRCF